MLPLFESFSCSIPVTSQPNQGSLEKQRCYGQAYYTQKPNPGKTFIPTKPIASRIAGDDLASQPPNPGIIPDFGQPVAVAGIDYTPFFLERIFRI